MEAATERHDLRSLTLYEPVATPFAAERVPPLREAVGRGDLDRVVEIVNRDVSGFSAEYVAELRRSPAWASPVPLAAPLAEELAAINAHSPRRGPSGSPAGAPGARTRLLGKHLTDAVAG